MLYEFQGIIGRDGLRSFGQSAATQDSLAQISNATLVAFWAVVDSESATGILRELAYGSRRRALRLLEETAVSLGSRSGPLDH